VGILNPNLAFGHTAAYNAGFNQGLRDKQSGNFEVPVDVCDSMDFQGQDLDHCVSGYIDARR
jgi:hypothetical protein